MADEGLSVSRYQLERWRRIGMLPRPRVIHDRFGGSRVESHAIEVLEAAAFLAQESQRGRPWQHVALAMFDHGYSLGEDCLRQCAVGLVLRYQRVLLGYWDEAAALGALTGDDPDDQAHQIAEIAVSIMRERRVTRPLVSFVRRDVQRLSDFGSRRARQELLHTALIYRVLDVARPGSLTDEERLRAITGHDSVCASGVTLMPSDTSQVARTITVREAEVVREWLVAQWNTGMAEARSDTRLLEDVLVEVTFRRLAQDREHVDEALPLFVIQELNADTDELLSELEGGYIPGQLSLDIDSSEA